MAQNKPRSITFIGRNREIDLLRQISADSKEAKIVIVHGRRRVGKTTLIHQVFDQRKLLKFEGLEIGGKQKQLEHATEILRELNPEFATAELAFKSWKNFFIALYQLTKKGPHTIYFEEVQWMANYREEFISDLKYVWDNYFQKNPQLILILCGSSPSFMVNKVLNSKALYNRSQHEIHLQELPFEECRQLAPKGYSVKEALDAYLLVGGIPEYYKRVVKESSAYVGFCKNAFVKDGYFKSEFERVFISSLAKTPLYRKIVEALSRERSLYRAELIKKIRVKETASVSRCLLDLELCGFIRSMTPVGKPHDSTTVKYEIADNYLQTYHRLIKPALAQIEVGNFDQEPTKALMLSEFYQWLGYAFERFCRKNQTRIAKQLEFSGIKYTAGSFFLRSNSEHHGAQIDLLFKRADNVYTVCEIKYQKSQIERSIIHEVEKKIAVLPELKKHSIQRVLITNAEISTALEKELYFDRVITLDTFLGENEN